MDYSQFKGQAIGWLIIFYVIFPLIIILPILAFIAWKYDMPKLKKVVKIIGIPLLALVLLALLSNVIVGLGYSLSGSLSISHIFGSMSEMCKLIAIVLLGLIIYKHSKKEDISKALIASLIIFLILYFVFNRLWFYGIFS